MAAFEYTSGNPANLVGAGPASMADIQGSFTDLRTFLNARIAAIPTLVSALPVGPVDGQEVHYLADASNGVVWHLRYRSASGSANKWEYVGGAALSAESLVSDGLATSVPYADMPTTVSVTAPLAGDYRVELGAYVSLPANTNAAIYIAAKFGAAGTSDNDAVVFANPVNNGNSSSVARVLPRRALAAATVVKLQYKNGTANAGAANLKYLTLRPLRVTG